MYIYKHVQNKRFNNCSMTSNYTNGPYVYIYVQRDERGQYQFMNIMNAPQQMHGIIRRDSL